MIVPQDVKNAMKNENFHFLRKGAVKEAGIAAGDGGSDGDVAEIGNGAKHPALRFEFPWRRMVRIPFRDGKRKNIRGARLAAIEAVPAGDLCVGDESDGDRFGRKVETAANSGEESFEGTNGDANAALAIENHPRKSVARRFPAGRKRAGRTAVGGARRGVLVVGLDDALDEIVADNVVLVEIDHGDSLDIADDFDGFDEAGAASVGQIDLGDVAGDDGLGIEAEAGEEHLHLLAGSVLRLVEDDDGIVESAAAHESERSDFDNVLFEEALELIGFEKVVQGVIERTHVGIDLLLKGAREKTEAFAGFDGGTGEDDAIDLLGKKSLDGHGDGEIGLSGTAGTDGENHIVRFESFDIALLIGAFRSDRFFAERAGTGRRKGAGERVRRTRSSQVKEGFHLIIGGDVAITDTLIVFVEKASGAVHIGGIAFENDVVIEKMSRDVQG